MDLLLGILLAAVSVAAVAATLWLLPNDGYGQRVFGTDDWSQPPGSRPSWRPVTAQIRTSSP